jgi:hypothetical protein
MSNESEIKDLAMKIVGKRFLELSTDRDFKGYEVDFGGHHMWPVPRWFRFTSHYKNGKEVETERENYFMSNGNWELHSKIRYKDGQVII